MFYLISKHVAFYVQLRSILVFFLMNAGEYQKIGLLIVLKVLKIELKCDLRS